ncbi:MAG: phosphoenolpyruvate--protein phosphotransferase, partial [Clostridia bacterium]|nr:phosphoenolpyruvate--protein phosphotransferase [Clostridia bacterium]
EFLFMDRDREPTEEEQFEAYSTVAKAMDGKEVIIRTLDIGGDKAIDYLKIDREDNPFLGFRAVRYCLKNKDLYKKQLRALLRAAYYGDVKIMIPLVTSLDEVKGVKDLIEECVAELEAEGTPYKRAPLGVMIETPSAAIISDLLAKEVEFFSIGTNDLTGYTMAVDRGNANVSHLYDTFQPAVLRAIEMTIKNAKAAGIMVGMCGEAAADENLIPKLVELGLDEFSVTPSSILATRRAICECE